MSWDDDDFEVNPAPVGGDAAPAALKADKVSQPQASRVEEPQETDTETKPMQVPKFEEEGFEPDPEPEPVTEHKEGPSRFAQVSGKKQKGKQKQAALLAKQLKEQNSQPIKLTPAQKAELESKVRASDFKNTEDLFSGVKSADVEQEGIKVRNDESDALFGSGNDAGQEEKASKLDTFVPNTAEQFTKFAQMLGEKMSPHQNSYYYVDFLKALLKESTTELSAEDLKELVAGLNVLMNSRIKVNTGKKSKKAAAAKKKTGVKKEELEEDFVEDAYDNDSFI